MADVDKPDLRARNLRTLGWLSLVVVAMLVFVAAMVPLYRLVCQRLGISTTLAPVEPLNRPQGPAGRTVTVRCIGVVNAGCPARLEPMQNRVDVRLGATHEVQFRAVNLSDRPFEFQAVHSVFPPTADALMHKLACFCYTRQTLAPHQTRLLSLVFWIEPRLDPTVDTVTVQYTMFALSPPQASPRRARSAVPPREVP